MKRILSFLVLGLLLTHFTGYNIYFIVRMNQIHEEMREQLKHTPDHLLTKFTFTKDEFKKVKIDEYEIRVDEKMYDLARIVEVGDRFIVFAKHDEAEDNLLAFLDTILENETEESSSESLTQFLTLNFLVQLPIDFCTEKIEPHHFTRFLDVKSFPFSGLDAPPPKV